MIITKIIYFILIIISILFYMLFIGDFSLYLMVFILSIPILFGIIIVIAKFNIKLENANLYLQLKIILFSLFQIAVYR